MKKNKRLLPFLFGVTALATLGITAVNSQVLIGTQDFSITVENAPDICEDPATVIGTTCSDGAVYAGLHNGQRLFVAPANEGAVQWKTSATYTPGTYGDDGFMNFAAIRQVGLSAHPAANACAAKGPDWFLPSVAEWQAIRANLLGASVSLSSIFATTSLHWTSESWGTGKAGTVEEDRVDTNYAFRPSDGAFFIRSRNSSANSALSHCVRHDGSRTYQDPCANGAPAVGTFCQSGAVYAGNGLFVAPNRTAAIQWKTSSTATPGTQSETDGVANTNAIAAAGLSAHPVANACRQMGEDWYLPANGEINTLFTNFGSAPKALRHAFLVNLTSYHWTSTEVPTDVTRAKVQDPAGSTLTPYKNATAAYAVRCMFDPGEGFVPEDLTPDEFLLSAAGDLGVAETAVLIAFSPVTITGINQPVPVSVAGLGSPEFSINGGGWVTSGTVSEGDVVTVRVSSAATLNTAHSGTLSVGNRDVGYTVTTRPATDFTPDAFVFADLLNQPTDTTVTSASVTPTGYEQMIVTPPAGVLVSVSGGAFLSDPQVVNAGDSLRVQVATGAFAPRTITGDVVFTSTGGVETYRTTWTVSVIAAPADQVDAFAFNWEYFPQTYSGTLPGGIYESELIALTGGSGSRPLRVLDSSGHYNSGTLNRWPRIYGSRIYYKSTNVTITTSLTDDANAVMWSTANTNYPNIVTDVGRSIRLKFAPANQSNEAYSILCVASTCAEHIWTNSATRSDPRAAKPFDIVDVTGAEISTVYTSAPFTVSWDPRTPGVRPANIPISVSGAGAPEYRVDGGAWTNVSGWVRSGSTVEVRQTSAGTIGTDQVATLSVGTRTSNYVVRTQDDTAPDAFTFAPITGSEPNALAVSAPVTITGITAPVPVSVSGEGDPQISTDGGATWGSTGTVSPNGSLMVRLSSLLTYDATRTVTVNVNGLTVAYSVTTRAGDATPDPFSFSDLTGQSRSTRVVSADVTITGLEVPTQISISGDGAPEYSLDGGVSWGSAPGTVVNNATVRVRLTSSGSYGAAHDALITIGGVTDTFSVTTEADPNADLPTNAGFASKSGVDRETVIISDDITISGLGFPVPISISQLHNAAYRINGGAWTAAAGTVQNGDIVTVRLDSPTTTLTSRSITLTVGSGTFDFQVTTNNLNLPVKFVGSTFGVTSATLPAHVSGDIIFALAYRTGSTLSITTPAGWTPLGGNLRANNTSTVLVYRVATSSSTTSGTFTGATRVMFFVYRNATVTPPTGSVTAFTNTGTTDPVNFPANSRFSTYATGAKTLALYVAPGIHNPVGVPAGTTARITSTTNGSVLLAESDRETLTWESTNASIGPIAANGWRSYVFRIGRK